MSAEIAVFLAGEGPNELGSRAAHPNYQSDEDPGVIEALLARVQPTGWRVSGACCWKDIRKFRAGHAGHAERRNVLAVVLRAKESNCDVVAFTRDSDGDPDRAEAIEQAIQNAGETPRIIGGVAVPTLEGWLLALLGVPATENMTPTKAARLLSERGVPAKNTAAMRQIVSEYQRSRIPSDARSLLVWLQRAEERLGTT